jgi:hypothetical protein
MTTFYVQNMVGEIHKLVYNNIDDIPLLIIEKFGNDNPLYEPIWLDEDGDEKVPPRNNQKMYVLYRYKDIPVKFIYNYRCIDENARRYKNFTILIKELYEEEIVIDFYKDDERDIFYSEKEFKYINILEEDYGSLTRYINVPEILNYYKSIRELFLSFRDNFHTIPDDFFNHLSLCVENYFTRYI